MPLRFFQLAVIAYLLVPYVGNPQALIQTGRYSAVYAVPTEAQRNPLEAIVTVEFPEAVTTVGHAVRHVLVGTGYDLSDSLHWDVEVFDLVNYPLPQIQRTLGPLSVLDVLDVLIGASFRVVVDPVQRQIAFERVLELDPELDDSEPNTRAEKHN